MLWSRGKNRDSVRDRYSERALKTWLAALMVLLSGVAAGWICSLSHLFVPSASLMICGFGVLLAMFAAVYLLIHKFRWVEPIELVKSTYKLGFVILFVFFAGRMALGLPPIPGQEGGVFILLAIVITLVAPAVPLFPIALAIGDGPPPVDESRLDEPPHL